MVVTESQVKAIQENWKTIRGRLQDYGNDLFMRYLVQNDGEQDHFSKFSSCPLSQLRTNAAFNAQTKLVMQALGSIVDHLDDIQRAAEFLRQRVRTHNRRHIYIAQFERLLDLMPMFLQETASADGYVADAWRILIADLMPAMRDEYARCNV